MADRPVKNKTGLKKKQVRIELVENQTRLIQIG